MRLKDKVAFITGAASGIGRATAIAMAAEGARVAVIDLNVNGLAETESRIIEEGGEATSIVADVTCSEEVQVAVEETVGRFGSLDCAHNNAGLSLSPTLFDQYSFEDIQRIIEVNLYGTMHCMQAQIAVMLSQGGGTIVNTASAAGLVGAAGNSAYSASKHAVIGLTRSVALEYGECGIRINAVCPGFVSTAMTDPILADEKTRRTVLAAQPIGRLGTPEEIADVVVWLSSEQSSYVVGATIAADGGYTAR